MKALWNTFASLGLLAFATWAGSWLLRPRVAISEAAPTDREIVQVAAAVDRALWSGGADSDTGLSATKVTGVALADSLLACRRLSLALVGTIPSLEEIRGLLSLPEEQRVASHLESLLADRRYADYFAERFARALVGDEEGPFLFYRRRRFVDWLANELAINRPYDVLITQVLADQGLWTGNPATNFVTVALREGEELPDVNQLAVRVSRALLGVRLDCAQCHDHPFDPRWKQSDFERLAAFFGSTGIGKELAALRGIGDELGPFFVDDGASKTRRRVDPRVPFASELGENQGTWRQRLASWLTDPQNPAFARATANRCWNYLVGRPLCSPVDDIPLELDLTDPSSRALDVLARDFSQHGFDLRRLLRVIASTQVFRAASRHSSAEGEAFSTLPASGQASRDVGEDAGSEPTLWDAFPITCLRGEQIVGSVLQAGSLQTIDYGSPLVARVVRALRESEFITRYGDRGERELEVDTGTIPQRLLMMNGEIVNDVVAANPLLTAAGRIALLAPSDRVAVETAFLATMTRFPTVEECDYFCARLDLQELSIDQRAERVSDLMWALLNTTEFSWNH